jgi:hypothetical protein
VVILGGFLGYLLALLDRLAVLPVHEVQDLLGLVPLAGVDVGRFVVTRFTGGLPLLVKLVTEISLGRGCLEMGGFYLGCKVRLLPGVMLLQ